MSNRYDIKDDEIRVLGASKNSSKNRFSWWITVTIFVVIAFVTCIIFLKLKPSEAPQLEESYFEPMVEEVTSVKPLNRLGKQVSSGQPGFTEVIDTIINDVPLRIYIPHKTKASLYVGMPDTKDTAIVYIAQAADIRADNKKILGAFVLHGKPLAWGLSKKGFCSIIGDTIKIGVADNTPLFEEATQKGGHFFRQYPLVNNRIICENKPKNKSLRRAICQRGEETFMVHSVNNESFHDFAQALLDLGCDNAVYLVGSETWGWCINEKGEKETWGVSPMRTLPQNTNYIIFRK